MNLRDALWQLGESDADERIFASLLAVILREMCVALDVDLEREFHPHGDKVDPNEVKE